MAARNDTIELIPVGHPTGMEWQMSLNNGKAQGPKSYPEVSVTAKDTDTITFNIRHPGAIKFADTNAFCAQVINAKTTTCAGPFSVTGGGTTQLVVQDANNEQSATDYKYVINFKNAQPIDPIIKNGGCCSGVTETFWSSPTGIALEIAAVALVIAFVVWRMMLSRRTLDKTKGL